MDICQFCGWEIKNPAWYNYYNQKPFCDDCNMDMYLEKEKEIKFMLDYRFGLGTYDEMLGMRRKIRAEREETVYKAMEAKRQIQNNMAIGGLSLGILCMLGGGMYLIMLATQ